MGALPKRKKSKSRAMMRLSHSAVKAPALVECPQCHIMIRPHHACPACGKYNGRDVVSQKEPKKTQPTGPLAPPKK
ncbi:MAG: 50S ribosomal protein L32 [Dehalococcoidales bacterium]|nr:50S ribosomal protein L32 [Dehalococcoidales bacterium]